MALHSLDATDRILCDALQKNGRIHFNELAALVGLSVPAVSERVRKLEERGVIRGYQANLNPEAFDIDILAFIFVTVDSSANYKAFIKKSRQHPEIMECHAMTGESSHMLKVRTRNTASLEKLLSDIQRWEGVRKTLTNLVLSTHVETLSLPTGAAETEPEKSKADKSGTAKAAAGKTAAAKPAKGRRPEQLS